MQLLLRRETFAGGEATPSEEAAHNKLVGFFNTAKITGSNGAGEMAAPRTFPSLYVRGTGELLRRVHMASTLEAVRKGTTNRRERRERGREREERDRSTEQREHLPGMHSALIALSASRSYTLVRAEPLKRPPLRPLPSSPALLHASQSSIVCIWLSGIRVSSYKYTGWV